MELCSPVRRLSDSVLTRRLRTNQLPAASCSSVVAHRTLTTSVCFASPAAASQRTHPDPPETRPVTRPDLDRLRHRLRALAVRGHQLTAPRTRKDGRLDLRLHRRRVDRREHGWGCGRVVRAPDGSDEVSHLPEETVAKNNGVCVCFLKFDISSLRERPAELRIESIAPPIIFVASKQASKHLPRTYKYSASMRAVQRRRLTRSIGPQYCRQSTYHTHTSH